MKLHHCMNLSCLTSIFIIIQWRSYCLNVQWLTIKNKNFLVASNISKKITKKKSDIKTFKRLKNVKQNNIYIHIHNREI